MKANAWQDTSKANWIDYALCWLSSALAVYSCGQAVATNIVSIIGVIGVTLGIGTSYLMRLNLGETKFTKLDGLFYCVMAWVAVLMARQLNIVFFPPDTFPIELTPSSWLLWMTVFGSFFAWRDGTIIFQAIPALAIFGIVGCYDTFKFVVFLFFLFLICFATLFARAHGRDMQQRAVKSGYFLNGRSAQMNPSEQSMLLRDGPWRWAAGAEWGLGSAMIIVVLSLIGAPVVQAGAKPISGLVNIRAPRLRNPSPPPNTTAIQTSATVGTGPVSLSDNPHFEVTGDVPDYLRTVSFNIWNGKAWNSSSIKGSQLKDRFTGEVVGTETPNIEDKFRFPNKKPRAYSDEYHELTLNILSLIVTREVLQSGNDPSFAGGKNIDRNESGISLTSGDKYEARINYDKVPIPGPKAKVPKTVDSHLYGHMSINSVPDSVSKLAIEVTKGIESDFEKALAIQAEITSRIKYNTNVAATPDNRDPVEYALTESHEGYCDLFASSMVLMARSVKIPARYAIGYLPDIKNKNSAGTQLLLESDRHAWAELYFEDIGWVVFDATAGATVVPGGGRKDNKPTDFNAILKFAGAVLNVLIAVAAFVGVWLYVRIRKLPKSIAVIRSELDAEYVSFIGSIWKFTGNRRLLSETTSEYLARVGGQLGDLEDRAKEIGRDFTDKMFGQPEILTTDVVEVRESVQNFKGLLVKMQKSR
jgi:transglutaminase-like putative cysteine protease